MTFGFTIDVYCSNSHSLPEPNANKNDIPFKLLCLVNMKLSYLRLIKAECNLVIIT